MVAPTPLDANGVDIIPREEFKARQSSAAIIAAARGKADAIIRQAERDAEREKKRGFIDGQAEGKQKAAIQMIETVTRSVEYLSSVEEALIDVVLDAVHKIIGDFDQEELVAKVVGKAIESLAGRSKVTIRVHPGKNARLRRKLESRLRKNIGTMALEIVSDAGLRPGAAILESDVGTINADIHHQMNAIETALRRSLQRRKADT